MRTSDIWRWLRRLVGRRPALDPSFKPKDFDWTDYYRKAEVGRDNQWARFLAPIIDEIEPDLSVVLDFACGKGRMAERFIGRAGKVICADVRDDAIDACRKRFANIEGDTRFEFLVNGDSGLEIDDETITFIYSWDAMVHFELGDVELYLGEFRRVLVPGGKALAHHSNYGSFPTEKRATWRENPGWRGTVSAADVRRICEANGLRVLRQQVIDWKVPELDCITIFERS